MTKNNNYNKKKRAKDRINKNTIFCPMTYK